MPELNASVIAVLLLLLFAALRKRLRLALIVLLVPAGLAYWAESGRAIETIHDALGIFRVGPMVLFLLAVLALLPRYTPVDRTAASS